MYYWDITFSFLVRGRGSGTQILKKDHWLVSLKTNYNCCNLTMSQGGSKLVVAHQSIKYLFNLQLSLVLSTCWLESQRMM